MIRPGDILAKRYQIQDRVGKGGFSIVYRAYDLVFKREVAVKVVEFDESEGAQVFDLLGEARSVASRQHPNILDVYDFNQEEDMAYLVMPYANGGTLSQYLKKKGQLSLSETTHFLGQIAAGMDFAHSFNIVHRDIKPQNILIFNERPVRLVISDFGLAKIMVHSNVYSSTRVSGTPSYMAPEQITGHPNRYSDIYALGVMTYQMLGGGPPYKGEPHSIMYAHMNQPVPLLSEVRPELPPQVSEVVARAMAKLPEERPRRAMDIYEVFKRALAASGEYQTREQPTAQIPIIKRGDTTPPPTQTQAATLPQSPAANQPKYSPPPAPTANPATSSNSANYSTSSEQFTSSEMEQTINLTPPAGSRAVAPAGDTLPAAPPPKMPVEAPKIPPVALPPVAPIASNLVTPPLSPAPQPGHNRPNFFIIGGGIVALALVIGLILFLATQKPTPPPIAVATVTPGLSPITTVIKVTTPEPTVGQLANPTVSATVAAPLSPEPTYTAVSSSTPVPIVTTAPTIAPTVTPYPPPSPTPALAVPALKAAFEAHPGASVQSVAYSPDGKLVASGASNNKVSLWDGSGANPKAIAELSGHQNYVNSVAFSPDGKILASSSGDATVRLWDVANRKEIRQLKSSSGQVIASISFSADGSLLAGTAQPNQVIVWRVDSGAELRRYTAPGGLKVEPVTFSPDGRFIAVGYDNGDIQLWNASDSTQPPRTLKGHSKTVWSLQFSLDSKQLYSSSLDQTFRLWDIANPTATDALQTISVQNSQSVSTVRRSADGSTLASSSRDGLVRLWSLTQTQIIQLEPKNGLGQADFGEAVTVSFSPDGKTLVAGYAKGTLRFWEASGATGRARPTLYVVQAGDTLDKIAQNFQTSPDAIKAANRDAADSGQTEPLLQPNGDPVAGKALVVPTNRPTFRGAGAIVGPGNDLAAIAKRHNLPEAVILSYNLISDPATLQTGQVLLIPNLA